MVNNVNDFLKLIGLYFSYKPSDKDTLTFENGVYTYSSGGSVISTFNINTSEFKLYYTKKIPKKIRDAYYS